MAKYEVAIERNGSTDHVTETVRGKRRALRRAVELRAAVTGRDLDALVGVTVRKV